MRTPVLFLAATLVLGAAGCSEELSVSPTPALTTIDVSLGASSIEVGQVTKVTATPLDQHGDSIGAGFPVFESSNPRVAEVDAKTGVVLGLSSGSAHIIATIGARSGERVVNVTVRRGGTASPR